jgi:hypothetical protein
LLDKNQHYQSLFKQLEQKTFECQELSDALSNANKDHDDQIKQLHFLLSEEHNRNQRLEEDKERQVQQWTHKTLSLEAKLRELDIQLDLYKNERDGLLKDNDRLREKEKEFHNLSEGTMKENVIG